MGLREYLQQLNYGVEQSKQLRQTADELRQQAAMQALSEQSPELIRRGDIGALVGMATQAGITKPLEEIVSAQAKALMPEKKTMVPFTKSEFITQGIPEDKATAFANLDYARQKEAVDNYRASVSSGLKEKEFNQHLIEEARRQGETVQKQRATVAKKFGELEKSMGEEGRIIKNIDFALKNPSQPADALVFSFIARNMAGEKGPLSEGDVGRITGQSLWENAAKAENYLRGSAASPLGSERRLAYESLINQAKANYSSYNKERIVAAFNQAIEDNPKLRDEGKIDEMLSSKAERLSKLAGEKISFKKRDDGNFEAVLSMKEAPQNIFQPDGNINFDAARKQIQLIQDTAIRENALKKLDKNLASSSETKKPIKPEAFKKFFESQVLPYLPQ